jgi:hypothetical protein
LRKRQKLIKDIEIERHSERDTTEDKKDNRKIGSVEVR